MKKPSFRCLALLLIGCFPCVALAAPKSKRGSLRTDLTGMPWASLPSTQWPGFSLPLPWATDKRYELRFFQPSFQKYIVAVTEVQPGGDSKSATIVSAVDFLALHRGEYPEQDCFYRNVPSCDGRLCDGLLVGVIAQTRDTHSVYRPREVWKITPATLRFERVPTTNVVCKPQSYAD